MFKQSKKNSDADLFNGIEQMLSGSRAKKIGDKDAWFNLFYSELTSRISEESFSVLYSEDNGRPNAPIRILLGMMILKEGFGWSDKVLFEECDFNIAVMRSLGLNNITDGIPSEATYYNFRRALWAHHAKTGEDLIGNMMRQLTKDHSKLFGVLGSFTRMDSTLVGSNIAKSTRLQLIIGVLNVFYDSIKESVQLLDKLTKEDKALFEKWEKRSTGQITYAIDNEQRSEMLKTLGYTVFRLVSSFTEQDSPKYALLERLLSEQYVVDQELIELKPNKDIASTSLQSAHDQDATFRNKHGENVSGYSVNITETCNHEGLNLITDVKVEQAHFSDNAYLISSLEATHTVVGTIGSLNADGAYHSIKNQDFAANNDINLILSGIQGQQGAYEFIMIGNRLDKILNRHTGELFTPKFTKEQYRIKDQGKYRHFDQKQIDTFFLRKSINDLPVEEKNRRNNVEATMFQLVLPLRNNKTKYRGWFKQQTYANNRCIWINFRRIRKHLEEIRPKTQKNGSVSTFLAGLLTLDDNNRLLSICLKADKLISGIRSEFIFFMTATDHGEKWAF